MTLKEIAEITKNLPEDTTVWLIDRDFDFRTEIPIETTEIELVKGENWGKEYIKKHNLPDFYLLIT